MQLKEEEKERTFADETHARAKVRIPNSPSFKTPS